MDATAFCSNHVWKRWFWPQKLSMNAPRFESAFWNAVYSKSAFWNAVYSKISMDATAFCSNHVWKRWFWPQKLSINAPKESSKMACDSCTKFLPLLTFFLGSVGTPGISLIFGGHVPMQTSYSPSFSMLRLCCSWHVSVGSTSFCMSLSASRFITTPLIVTMDKIKINVIVLLILTLLLNLPIPWWPCIEIAKDAYCSSSKEQESIGDIERYNWHRPIKLIFDVSPTISALVFIFIIQIRILKLAQK